MDAWLAAILQSTPSWGVGGLLITYIIILIRREGSVAERHTSALNQLTAYHASELDRVNADHDEEIAELKKKIRELRDDLNSLDTALSTERSQRLGLPPRRQLGRGEHETRGGYGGPQPVD